MQSYLINCMLVLGQLRAWGVLKSNRDDNDTPEKRPVSSGMGEQRMGFYETKLICYELLFTYLY